MARFFRSQPKKLSEVIGDYTMAASRRNDAPGNIRSDRFVISSRTNVLTDEEAERSTNLKTVRIMLRRKDGKFLCVVDHDNMIRVGFPGGRIEPGEAPLDAAVRELWEETGLIVDDAKLIDISSFRENEVFLFLANDYEGTLKSSHEGRVAWCSPATLTSGFFGDYYLGVFKRLGHL